MLVLLRVCDTISRGGQAFAIVYCQVFIKGVSCYCKFTLHLHPCSLLFWRFYQNHQGRRQQQADYSTNGSIRSSGSTDTLVSAIWHVTWSLQRENVGMLGIY